MTKGIQHLVRGAMLAATAGLLAPSAAFAQAEDWQIYFPEPASPTFERILTFSNGVLVVITLITLFVLGLLAWVLIRYNAKSNPVPSKTTHNSVIEVLWTVVPVLILVGISIPSFNLLFAQYDPGRVIEDYDPAQALNVKITGYTWFWSYEYTDEDVAIATYFSNPIRDAAGGIAGEPRLLQTDNPMVVPEGVVVRLAITSSPTGVIHAFALPHMGVKVDAVPGRVTEAWFLANRQGTFYGQCSELCGKDHAFMPIELRVVSAEQFDQWVAEVRARGTGAGRVLLDQWAAELALQQVAAR